MIIIVMIIVIIFDFYINLKKSSADTFNYIIKILKFSANTSVSIIIIIDLCLKYVISSEMIIYEKFDIIKSLI